MLETMPNPPRINHATHVEPAYDPQSDLVLLPHLSQFESGTNYATLFHELAHATGHATRLNRFGTTPGDRMEREFVCELVAESFALLSSVRIPASISNQRSVTGELHRGLVEGITFQSPDDPSAPPHWRNAFAVTFVAKFTGRN